ncbi:DUF4136 domain-containing protein [bacterium]|nr:DUF4136 domain-containing protein [bacterium]
MKNLKNDSRLHLAIRTLALGALTLWFAGCATTSPTVNTKIEPGTDFGRYKSFAILPVSRGGAGVNSDVASRVARPAEEEAAATLTAAGFRQVDQAGADFSVLLRGESIPKIAVTDWGFPPTTVGGSAGLSGARDVDVDEYDERTLWADVYDNQTKKPVWTGWVKRKASGEITVEGVRAAVRTVLSAFPPK